MLREERARLVREQGIHEHVFFALRQIADFLGELVERRGVQRRGRNIGRQHFGIADNLLIDCRIDGAWRLAVVAAQVIFHFLGNNAPARAGKHVEHGLRANNLAHGRHERWEADLGTHARNLANNFVKAIGRFLNLKLAHEV